MSFKYGKKIAATLLAAACVAAIYPAAGAGKVSASVRDSRIYRASATPEMKQALEDLYDSATALLAMHSDELSTDVRISLETVRGYAYNVMTKGDYNDYISMISDMRVSLAVAIADLNGTTANTNIYPEYVIGTAGYNRSHPLLISSAMATDLAQTYINNRNQLPATVRDQVLGLFVNRIYVAALGRNSEDAGRNYWINSIKSGERSADDVVITILQSAEFNSRNLSDEAYVTALYQIFFDRTPDSQGFTNWVNALKSGASRIDIARAFVVTPEWDNLCSYYGL